MIRYKIIHLLICLFFSVSCLPLGKPTQLVFEGTNPVSIPETIPVVKVSVASVNQSSVELNFEFEDQKGLSVDIWLDGQMVGTTMGENVIIPNLDPGKKYSIKFKSSTKSELPPELQVETLVAQFGTFDIESLGATPNSLSVTVPEIPGVQNIHYYLDDKLKFTTDKNTYKFEGLTPNTSYNIKIVVSGVGHGDKSQTGIYTTPKDHFSGLSLNIVSRTANSFKAVATKPAGAEVFTFKINGVTKASSSLLEYSFIDLGPNEDYVVEVLVKGNGFNDLKKTEIVRTLKSDFNSFSLSTSNIKDHSFRVSVPSIAGATNFYYYLDNVLKHSSSSRVYDFLNLDPNKSYNVSVKASGNNYNDRTESVTARTLKSKLPPLTVQQISVTDKTVELTISSNENIQDYHYVLEVLNDDVATPIQSKVLSLNEAQFSNLKEATDYQLRVSATSSSYLASDELVIPFKTNPAEVDIPPENAGFKKFLNSGSETDISLNGELYVGDKNMTSYVSSRTYSTGTAEVFQSGRYDKTIQYKVPVKNGLYKLQTFHFEDFWQESNKRVFDIKAEETLIKSGFDIVALNQGPKVSLSFDNIEVKDGILNLDFMALKDNATVSAIAIVGPVNEGGETEEPKLSTPVISNVETTTTKAKITIQVVPNAQSYTYRLEKVSGSNFVLISNVTIPGTTHEFLNLENLNNYRVKIVANATGHISSNELVGPTFKTEQAELGEITITNQSSSLTGLSFNIEPVPDATHYVYNIHRKEGDSFVQVSGYPKTISQTSLSFDEQKFSTTYKISVFASAPNSSYKDGPISTTLITTGQMPKLGNVTGLTISTVNDSVVININSLASAASYTYFLDKVDGSVTNIRQSSSSSTSHTFTTIPLGNYRVRVIAKASGHVDSNETSSGVFSILKELGVSTITILEKSDESVKANVSIVNGAQAYIVYLKNVHTGVVIGPQSITPPTSFGFLNLDSDTSYELKVVLSGSGYKDSEASLMFMTEAKIVAPPASSGLKHISELQMADRSFVSSVLKYIFKLSSQMSPPLDTIYYNSQFGGACDPYAAAGYGQPVVYEFPLDFCTKNASHQPLIGVVEASVNNAARYAITTKVCEQLVVNDVYLNNALSHFGASFSTAPDQNNIAKAYELFYPYKTMGNSVKSAFVSLAGKEETIKNKWKVVILGLCLSPEWQTL